MPSQRKRNKFLGWLSHVFSPSGFSRSSGSSGFFSHAHGFTQNNPVMLQGHNNTVTYVQGDQNLVSHVMGLLQQQSIRGAAHDSSARSPPPRCHPQTRVQLVARITAWFDGQGRHEFVLWITGPAGVGKSAVVQTIAEHLVQLELLGASVFFSRPNKRDNPHGVFITIAYQLAARIEAYRDFVIERLCRDPELINGDMEAQFRTFIVEPFVGKKIGAGGKRWGILLDGLDELKGEAAQRKIIRLVTGFAREHPEVPLAWLIASRPESYICDTFADDDLPHSYWSENIPIDSTEACEDVDRFLRSEFKAIRKEFRHSVPRDWPSETDFLKLTAAALGLFIYAQVVMQFLRDPEYSDPTSRFKVLLSVIDRSNANENPFVHLDTLYHEILCSIPSNLWPTTKRLLRCVVHWQAFAQNWFISLPTLRGMSILLGLPRHVIYACLLKCQSVLRVPDWKVSHKKKLKFLHASFADYLKDSRRSDNFYIGSEEEAVDDMDLSVLAILNECCREDVDLVEAAWRNYCSRLDDEPPSSAIIRYHGWVLHDIAYCFAYRMDSMSKAKSESPIYAQLRNVHMIKVSSCVQLNNVTPFGDSLMRAEAEATGLFRFAQLKDLKFGHLDCEMMRPVNIGDLARRAYQVVGQPLVNSFVATLKLQQKIKPEAKVVILGGIPEGRIAVLRYPIITGIVSIVIPYPE